MQCYFFLTTRDATPQDVIRRREMKWLQMLDNWDKYMSTKYKKVLYNTNQFSLVMNICIFNVGEGQVSKGNT